MGLFDIFKSKKKVNTEAEWREVLRAKGRITDGIIIDSEVSENGEETVSYQYTIQGVDFESSEVLTEKQRENLVRGFRVEVVLARHVHKRIVVFSENVEQFHAIVIRQWFKCQSY